MDTPDPYYKKFDVRLRLFIFEMIVVATLMSYVLPYMVVSSKLNAQHDTLVMYFIAVVVATILVVLSAAYPISRLTRPIREYFDALETSQPDPALLLEVRARSLNLPILFTATVMARYWGGEVLIVLIMGLSGALSPSESLLLLVRGMLAVTPGFVFLFFICERIVQPVRQSVALHCRGLRGASREKVVRVSILTRFLLIGFILMALHLTAIGVMSHQVISELEPPVAVEVRNKHFMVLLLLGCLAMVLSTVVSLLAARSISQPLRRAATIMEAVGKGNLDLRVDVLTNDETASLGESFNQMVDQLQESQRQLRAANDEIRALNRGLEQKVLERTHALQLEASKNIVILQSIADGVMVFDARQRAILANRAVESMLRLKQNEILGRHVSELVQKGSTMEERDRSLALLTGMLLQSQAGGSHTPVFLKFKLGERTLAASLAPISEPTPELQGGFVAVYRDITEEEAAIELARLNHELVEANRLKSQFLATMSHELRTPMNSIIGYCQVLLRGIDGPLNDEQGKDVQRIMESGQNLLAIINDILDLSKIDAGRLEIRTRSVNLDALLNSVVSTIAPLAARKGLKVDMVLDDDVPLVWADEDRLRQVLMNLLSNAVKFTRDGEIRIEVKDSGGQVQVSVVDTGVGIDPGDHQAIFDEFYQVDGSRTREFGGTGLGLAITRRLVELMGGHIWVESALGAGSRFTFTVPVHRPEVPSLNQVPVQSLELRTGEVPVEAPEPAVSRERVVLVVDDDPAVLDLVERFLGEEGYRVVGAKLGQEGLRLARELKPMAVILDLILPDIGGLDLLRELKASPETDKIPVLILSVADSREEGLSLGAVDYLQKPVNREELIRKLVRLERQSGRVLVVDDDATVRELLVRLVGDSGYEVQTVRGGEEALAVLKEGPPQVMILDLMMLPMSGFEVLARMRERGLHAGVKVVVLTAKELTIAERDMLNTYAAVVMQKSLSRPEDLLRGIRECLRRLEPVPGGDRREKPGANGAGREGEVDTTRSGEADSAVM